MTRPLLVEFSHRFTKISLAIFSIVLLFPFSCTETDHLKLARSHFLSKSFCPVSQ